MWRVNLCVTTSVPAQAVIGCVAQCAVKFATAKRSASSAEQALTKGLEHLTFVTISIF